MNKERDEALDAIQEELRQVERMAKQLPQRHQWAQQDRLLKALLGHVERIRGLLVRV